MTSNYEPVPEPSTTQAPGDPGTTTAPATPRKVKGARRTRTSFAWTGLVVGVIILILLLVFILQNLESVRVHVFFWWFSMPLGVGILLAAIAGAVVMAIAGGARILQLRRAAKRI